ncbi:putative short-chain dehydrogenase/reductase [Xylariaceae sp. FL0594]|nr:putative short-chain dehydrogenase/reductase [Xylariaceae sp. FL0594]
MKTVLITGCSAGGLGAALAVAFHEAGCRVYATARTPSKIPESLTSLPNVEVLALDVTDERAIGECVAKIKTARIQQRKSVGKGSEGSEGSGGRGLDILVNNAGAGFLMPVLDTPIEEARKTFEVNFWGVLAMVKAFAPLLIDSGGGGVVVNVASIAGAVPLPWQAIYNSSKAAVAMLSETLRLELSSLGVRVVTAMVGAVETDIYNKQHQQHFALPASSLYLPAEEAIKWRAAGGHQADIEEPAEVTAGNIVRDVLGSGESGGGGGKIWRGGRAGATRLASCVMPQAEIDKRMMERSGFEELRVAYKDGVPRQG